MISLNLIYKLSISVPAWRSLTSDEENIARSCLFVRGKKKVHSQIDWTATSYEFPSVKKQLCTTVVDWRKMKMTTNWSAKTVRNFVYTDTKTTETSLVLLSTAVRQKSFLRIRTARLTGISRILFL